MDEHQNAAASSPFQPLANPRRLRLSTADTTGARRLPRHEEAPTEQVTGEYRRPAAS